MVRDLGVLRFHWGGGRVRASGCRITGSGLGPAIYV